MKIIIVAGARPNFMKIAPLMKEMDRHTDIATMLVHTGQHYDEAMSDLFFRQLGIPEPDINLDVRSGSHATQTAAVMTAFEPILLEHRPDAVLVVGDVNSTIACGLVAVKMGVSLIHVEAGLRSGDRGMPEEINRVLTDAISDLLFCTERSALRNLANEGVSDSKVYLVGNVMIDTLLENQRKFEESPILDTLGVKSQGYAVLTMHRPSNVDDRTVLGGLVNALGVIQRSVPVIFPAHPRTKDRLKSFGFLDQLEAMADMRLIDPVGYLDFQKLLSNARVVLTDSGGIQEETTVLKVPCLTLRENTERPSTIEQGSNRLVGMDSSRILEAFDEVMTDPPRSSEMPEFWDGKAASRIVEVIRGHYPQA